MRFQDHLELQGGQKGELLHDLRVDLRDCVLRLADGTRQADEWESIQYHSDAPAWTGIVPSLV